MLKSRLLLKPPLEMMRLSLMVGSTALLGARARFVVLYAAAAERSSAPGLSNGLGVGCQRCALGSFADMHRTHLRGTR